MWVGHFGSDRQSEVIVIVDVFIAEFDHFQLLILVDCLLENGVDGGFEILHNIFNEDNFSIFKSCFHALGESGHVKSQN